MNYLATEYIYPIKEPILLSSKYKYYLDNPRNEEEVSFLRETIKEHHENKTHFRFPPRGAQYISLATMLREIGTTYQKDDYCSWIYKKHYSAKSYDSIYEFMARIWIIARFDDEGQTQAIKKEYDKMKEEDVRGVVILDDEHPIEKNANHLVDYSHLISLLINAETDEYYGQSFIPSRVDFSNDKIRFTQDLMMLYLSCHHTKKDNMDWMLFPKVKDRLLEKIKLLDEFLSEYPDDKLNYISNILTITSEGIGNDNVKVVLLTSIIEFLLTRNPDTTRFNVEDSINKQFQLKASILIYQSNKHLNLNKIKNNLKQIYTLRSLIAHGNMHDLHKIINKGKKKSDDYYLETIVSMLYEYIRIIIEEYIKDPKYIEHIKSS